MMSKDYGSWSVADLKAELRKRNVKLTGKKAVLVQRLEDCDKLFGGLINDPDHSYRIIVPDNEKFLDIHANATVPNITDADLETYSMLAERENVQTSKQMYDEEFLLSCRISNETSGVYYVTATCASEMRKNVIYNITLKITENVILEAQCECAAGVGPYAQCKHVLVVIYAIVDFTKTKKIKTRASCTSQLQSFHQPANKYSGEPVKAENLKLKIKQGKFTTFDPSPKSASSVHTSNESYNQYFKNTVVNFCGQNHVTMPMAQLIRPANKKAVYLDHDYMEKTPEQMFIKSMYKDDERRRLIEQQTKEDKKEWKRERVKRLQSSDFGKICKCEKTKKKLAKALTVMTEIPTAAIKHGIKYEKSAIKKFEELTDLKVKKAGILIHNDQQFLGCTPDGLIGEDELIEVKCPYTAREKYITPETVPYIYLCEKTGNYKLSTESDYYHQIQGQLLCTGRKAAYLCIYTIRDCLIIKVKRNEDFIHMMFLKLEAFYYDYFENALLNKYLYNEK